MERANLVRALAAMMTHERNMPRLADLYRDSVTPPEELAIRAAEELATDRALEWLGGASGWISVLEMDLRDSRGEWGGSDPGAGVRPYFPLDVSPGAIAGRERGFERRINGGLWKGNSVFSWIAEDGRALRVMSENVVLDGICFSVRRLLRSRPWSLSEMDGLELFPPLFRHFWDLPEPEGPAFPEGRFDFSQTGPRRW